jgi:voltage-gated potassium channel
MNPSLFILGRFEDQGTEGKLKKAGADRTVSPHMIGGLRMASLLLRPNVTEFIELATASSSIELQMDEVTLKDGSRFAGRTIKESRIKRDHGVMVVGIKKPKGETRVDPDPNTVLHPGDLLIVLGKTDLVLKFKQGEEIESRLPE